MRFKQVGNKYDIVSVVVRNTEASNPIKVGSPCVLNFDGTDATVLGKAVKTSNSLAAAEQGNFFGLAMSQINAGEDGEAQVFGYNNVARTVLTTRSATNATWASQAAGAIGEYLTMMTGTGNAASNGDQALVRVATAAMTVRQFVRMMETFASVDTLASTLGPQSQTIWTTTRKVFLRAM